MIPSKRCAFVSFVDRSEAEKAFKTLYERLFLKGTQRKLKLLWAKQQLDISAIKKKKKVVANPENEKSEKAEEIKVEDN